jgi:tRNA pseudouridine38/39 synthase
MFVFRKATQTLIPRNAQRVVPTMSQPSELHNKLFEALFPGETFSPERSNQLAVRLRQVANKLLGKEPDKNPNKKSSSSLEPSAKKSKIAKQIDFTAYQQRYVALEVMYVGHDFHGFVRQDNIEDTIEEHLWSAFKQCRLIPPELSWQELKYSRGGRTDKGVSGLGQIVALLLRSAGKNGEEPVPESREYDYPALLNRCLPPEIRVLGWSTIPESFSARFSAQYREYKYFIVDDGKLDVEKMRQGAQILLGEHDFRNFCKPDVVAVKSFVRTILETRLEYIPDMVCGQRRVLELYIRGTAFLWHQVRCIASLLLMIGQGKEEPGIMTTLLDIEATPRKPLYLMASEEPLLLFNCKYPNLEMNRSQRAHNWVRQGLDESITSHLTRAAILHAMEQRVLGDEVQKEEDTTSVLNNERDHVPLLERPKMFTVEEMMEKKAGLIAMKEAKYEASQMQS